MFIGEMGDESDLQCPRLGKLISYDTGESWVFAKEAYVFKVLKEWSSLEKLTDGFNKVFPETKMVLWGVAKYGRSFHPVLKQRKVEGRSASQRDIDKMMRQKGFEELDEDIGVPAYVDEDETVVTDIAPGHNVVKSGGEAKAFDADVYDTVDEFLKATEW
jgi:hypothetical protein